MLGGTFAGTLVNVWKGPKGIPRKSIGKSPWKCPEAPRKYPENNLNFLFPVPFMGMPFGPFQNVREGLGECCRAGSPILAKLCHYFPNFARRRAHASGPPRHCLITLREVLPKLFPTTGIGFREFGPKVEQQTKKYDDEFPRPRAHH